jgi:hypothetical protein
MDNRSESALIMFEGNLRAWLEQEAIHLKAVDKYGDPLELTGREARTLAQRLVRLAEMIGE